MKKLSQKTFRVEKNVLMDYNNAFEQINTLLKITHKKVFEEMLQVWMTSQNNGLIDPTLYHKTKTKYECRSINELNIARGILRTNEGGNGLSICFDSELLKKKEHLILVVQKGKTVDDPNPYYKTPFSKTLDDKILDRLKTHFNNAIKQENVSKKEFYKKKAGQLLAGTSSSQDDIKNLANNLQNIKELSIGNIIELFHILDVKLLDDAYATHEMEKIVEFGCLDNLYNTFKKIREEKDANERIPTNNLTRAINKIAERLDEADFKTKSNLIKRIADFSSKL